MAVRNLSNRKHDNPGGTFQETVPASTTSNPVAVFQTRGRVTVRLIAGSNYGKIQTTTSPDSAIEAGTAVWVDWSAGSTTGTRTSVFNSAITGLRCVAVGEVTWEVVI